MANAIYILVLNSGSSSLKFALYEGEHCAGRGVIKNIGKDAHFSAKGELFSDRTCTPPVIDDGCLSTTDATHILIKWLETVLPLNALKAVGHRIVHGGDLTEPTLITPDLLMHLRSLAPLAPLHQPFNLEAIDLIARLHPDISQVACFDTSFHATMPSLHRRFALPRKWHEQGVRRYGFHGLSYEYVSSRLQKISPKAFEGRTIAAHLGNGASLCALKGGESYDMSMGFSALDGLVMGTRPGTLDAGVILYLLQEVGLDATTIEHMLYHESGLLGVSGISSNMKILLAQKETEAQEAISLFCLRITREAGGLISLLGGLDALVFTGGIGEHAAKIRENICLSLAWIGIEVDTNKNAMANGDREVLLSTSQSKIEIWMIPTDEEAVIATRTSNFLSKKH